MKYSKGKDHVRLTSWHIKTLFVWLRVSPRPKQIIIFSMLSIIHIKFNLS
jgi:hypothetical protein